MSEHSNLLTVFATVYNIAQYLPRFFQCMENQTYRDYTLLIIDDGSVDETPEICRSYAQKDPRIVIVHQSHKGISAARNAAISMINTPLTASVDGDDVYEPDYLRHLVEAWEKYDADLVISRVAYRNEAYVKTGETKAAGELFISRGEFADMLPVLLEDRRLNYLFAKLFKSGILKKTHVEEDVEQGSDTILCCQYAVMVNSILLTDDLDTNYIRYTSRSVTSLHDKYEYRRLSRIQAAITEIFKNAGLMTVKMQRAVDGRVFQSALWALSSVSKMDIPVNEALHLVHDIFRSAAYLEAYYRQKKNPDPFGFSVVDPESVIDPCLQISPRIVVSMTSYPSRIQNAAKVLETVFSQTRKADEVVLWLAKDEFPMRTIPESLAAYVDEGKLQIRWCDNLMSHKKYFFAFSEFPNDLIITIDDDLLYAPTMIEDLFRSYLVHPKAVSALRTHLMITENGRFLPYMKWLHEYDLHVGEESMMLFATTGAGTLFPVYLFNLELLDADAVRETCLYADDIWLKLMQIEADIPVVIAKRYSQLNQLPATGETGLYTLYNKKLNDVQLNAALSWYDHLYGKDFILNKLEGYNDKLGKAGSVIEYYTTMIGRKNAELRKKNDEINRYNEEIRRKDTELRKKSEEIDKYTEKIRKKDAELRKKTEEIDRDNEKIRRKDTELRKKTEEIDRYNEELREKTEKIDRYTEKLRERNQKIKQQKREISAQRNEIIKIWNSRSLQIGRIITWPCRIIKDIFR